MTHDNFNEQLRRLVAEACQTSAGSWQRQQKITQLYRLVIKSGKLWKETTPYYQDALQEMWEYCCQHLEEYDPTVKEVTTWLDDELKKRLRRYRYAKTRDQQKHSIAQITSAGEIIEPIDNLKANVDVEPLLEMWKNTLDWVQTDPEGKLKKTIFRKRHDINCQALFLLRFPTETPWKTIAEQFKLTPAEAKDLPKWYNRRCLPMIREFGVSQGYLD